MVGTAVTLQQEGSGFNSQLGCFLKCRRLIGDDKLLCMNVSVCLPCNGLTACPGWSVQFLLLSLEGNSFCSQVYNTYHTT